ncbi:g9535 [Coccomyxa viridis]|uniref:Fatty acyl-CoA reductase n=1 Tax=Coccomyxa viridis TaxID=1274662 RepID=A0ABP1G398_9CHLO
MERLLGHNDLFKGAFYIKDVGLPNVYTFTKNLAEQLMLDLHAVDFPVSIVRPTIVSCLNGAPAPGYFGNNSGAIAFVMAFATGMAHHTCHDQDHHVQDVIPCDLVASVIIAAGAIRHQIKPGSTPSVFHVASSTTHSEPVANQFRRIFLPYWTQRPPPFTLYSRPYRKLWKKGFYSPEESLTFRTWKLYNTEAMDFNLFFSVSNTAALYDSLPKSTASDFKMLWQAPEDSWDDYYRLVFDAIHTKIFKTQSA